MYDTHYFSKHYLIILANFLIGSKALYLMNPTSFPMVVHSGLIMTLALYPKL